MTFIGQLNFDKIPSELNTSDNGKARLDDLPRSLPLARSVVDDMRGVADNRKHWRT